MVRRGDFVHSPDGVMGAHRRSKSTGLGSNPSSGVIKSRDRNNLILSHDITLRNTMVSMGRC